MPLFTPTLPRVHDLQDCASYALTVEPYIDFDQIRSVPDQVLAAFSDPDPLLSLHTLYLTTNPLVSGFLIVCTLAPIFLIVSEINRNYSQVDRFWSLLPSFFIANFVYFAHANGLPTKRLDLLQGVSLIWSARLTFNYWRRGGYKVGSEDYRWEIVQSWMPKFVFFLFNVTFISFYQLVLLFSVITPAYVLLLTTKVTGDELDVKDYAFAAGMVGMVITSFIADQQQWNYQTAKYHYINTKELPKSGPYTMTSLNRGFNTHGLWALSRHPNFAAEQSVWFILYNWGVYSTDSLYNWTAVGILSYLMLFQGSTWLTESITASKYPEYKEYQKNVSRFLPKPTAFFTEPVPRTPAEKGVKPE